jgi:hypothetical protein
MKTSKSDAEHKQLRKKIEDNLVAASFRIDDIDQLPHTTIAEGMDQMFVEAQRALAKEGCDLIILDWSLRLGRAAVDLQVGVYPAANKIKKLADQMTILADNIERLEETGFLEVFVQEETQRLYEQYGRGPEETDDLGQILPHLELHRWLRKKAEMYYRWGKLASEGVPPNSGAMSVRLRYLFPSLYVRAMTGKPCRSVLVDLLETVGVKVSGEQISRGLKELRRDYKRTSEMMITLLCALTIRNAEMRRGR